MERVELRRQQQSVRGGIRDPGHRPGESDPDWPLVLRIEFPRPTGVKCQICADIDPGPNAYQKPETAVGGAPEQGVFSNDGKTMYVVDYGEVYTNFQMPTPFYHCGEVRRDLDDHLYGPATMSMIRKKVGTGFPKDHAQTKR